MEGSARPQDKPVTLVWRKFRSMTEAGDAIKGSCIYVIADPTGRPLYIGETGQGKGIAGRYKGGTASAVDAALHESGNLIYAAAIANADREEIEKFLIFQERPLYNRVKSSSFVPRDAVQHHGDVPTFQYLTSC